MLKKTNSSYYTLSCLFSKAELRHLFQHSNNAEIKIQGFVSKELHCLNKDAT